MYLCHLIVVPMRVKAEKELKKLALGLHINLEFLTINKREKK